MTYKNILFDLDGTLTDPGTGITNSVAHALRKYGITVEDHRELFKFIGPPLHESFETYYEFSKEEAFTAVEYYREYYRDRGIFENILYEGIPELLNFLHARGYILAVATSKPEVFAKQILDHFALGKYFTYIAGSNLDGTRTKKAEVIDYALRSSGIYDKSSTIMIGDREHDIFGAKTIGIDSIGVLFGYQGDEKVRPRLFHLGLAKARFCQSSEMLRDLQSLRSSGAPSWRAQRVLHHAVMSAERGVRFRRRLHSGSAPP